ncbi:GNAT family N-acetyltransferase [Hymenobacter sp. BT770]|uniref:GNAT family N-acetyltransferase n=1 Tax=Hymenobacter sp. BT770 TaxID=2886942 RepID=UPI001D1073FB|nr:GNAT family N-acetyltransferase [Hymenobacter sp. BT770]MCC3153887.1 GNAT family N-acetyltransferase [Hymenobacter sp. BT770]MDO3416031.1 GNAT family N-acetyltransferase [Hymenobacter sp. BT770]
MELTEARSNAAMVESRARLSAEVGAAHAIIAGTYACFDGPGSPLTQTFGLGLFEVPTAEIFAQLERYFRERKSPVLHEVSPLAAPETLHLLGKRGYRPLEFTNVMYRPIEASVDDLAPAALRTRPITPAEVSLWAQTSARGWGAESEELGAFMLDFAPVLAQARGMHAFLVEADGKAIAAGSLFIEGNVVLLAGASTVSEARGQGAQRALLTTRLNWAAHRGCTLAMMCAQPGSQSQRNAERAGFQVAYTRLKWQLPPA